MDALVKSGRAFTRHYVQAPTCGASRYALLAGRYATSGRQQGNDAFFGPEARKPGLPPTFPAHFRENGYQTVAVGKISHYPGGLGGKNWNWNDPEKVSRRMGYDLMPTDSVWKHPQGAMHGYAGGVPRGKYRPVREHDEGDDLTYADSRITREALKQMEGLAAAEKPFLFAVGLMKLLLGRTVSAHNALIERKNINFSYEGGILRRVGTVATSCPYENNHTRFHHSPLRRARPREPRLAGQLPHV